MSSNRFTRAAGLLLPMLLVAAHAASAAEPAKGNCPAAQKGVVGKKWTQATYAKYVEAFNKDDMAFGDFYDDNVYWHDDPGYHGRQAMVDFYKKLRANMKETNVAKTVVIDNDKGIIAVELTTTMEAKQDAKMGPMTMKKGESMSFDGVIFYTLKDGCIADIRGRMVRPEGQMGQGGPGGPGGPPPGAPPQR